MSDKLLNWSGKILVKFKAAWYWESGSVVNHGLFWWHPLTWVVVLTYLILGVPMAIFSDFSYPEIMKELIGNVKSMTDRDKEKIKQMQERGQDEVFEC